MSHYWEWVKPMMAHLAPTVERTEGMSERLWETRVRAAACDALRYLLPTATQTNLGWTANARVLEHAISKLRSHTLEEMRAIGESLREVATERVPTLLRYADPSDFLERTPALMRDHAQAISESAPLDDQWDVQLVHFDHDAEERVVAALLYEHIRTSYEETLRRVRAMSPEERGHVLDDAIRHRGKHDQVGRAWETTTYTFDTLMDYGAFRDLQRHRLATQINQAISASHGYLTPPEIASGGFEEEYRRLMDQARGVHDAMAEDLPGEAPYAVPLAYRKRTLFTMNLRELHHMIQLRTGPQGHVSYRLLANRLLEEIRRVHPALAAQIRHTPMI
jgi:thymidylate synthase ThyX